MKFTFHIIFVLLYFDLIKKRTLHTDMEFLTSSQFSLVNYVSTNSFEIK